jgi:diamine N-acetyltransferase
MIFGERIRFRGVEKDDLPHFMKWINDPEVLQGIGVYLPLSMADEQDWFDKMRARPPEEHNLAIEVKELTTEDQETWTLIGSCGFFNFDKRNACAEFGIMIGEKSYWNRGFGTESVRLLAHYGFHTLNLNRIYLRVLETNPRAIRAYENAGFSHEGRQRQADFRDGKYIDLLVMSLLVGEY